MAIQVWDKGSQSYKGVELARFGQSGTLVEALVWVDGQYKRVWPVNPDWVDDFTAPELHSRWMLMGGEYAPPGLSTDVLGPVVAESFELTHTRGGDGYTVVGVIDGTFTQGVAVQWDPFGGVHLLDPVTGEKLVSAHGRASTVGLRRADGLWHLLIDGEAVVSTPDLLTGVDLSTILSGTPDTPITSVTYTVL